MILDDDLYLDHNATSPLRPAVRERLAQLLRQNPANPASSHEAGRRSARLLREARGHVSRLVGAGPDQIVFTSGGTEANHLALFGLVGPAAPARHIVVSAIEHPSVLEAADLLGELGHRVTRVAPAGDGQVAARAVLDAVEPDTALVSLQIANNETGVLQPVQEVARLLGKSPVAFHVDAAQAPGRLALDVARLPVAALSLSAHKLGGPTGAGALYLRPGTRLRPLLRGGLQERGRRGGTHNLAGIVGFGEAARDLLADPPEARATAARRDLLEQQLLARVPGCGVNGCRDRRLPNTSNLYFEGVDATELLRALSSRGLHASAGSACHAGAPEPSHVLRAMGLGAGRVRGSVRFSLGPGLPEDWLARAVSLVAETVEALRSGAPRVHA